MEKLITWLLASVESRESYGVLQAKLELLLCVVRTVPSYTVEDIVENMLKEEIDA